MLRLSILSIFVLYSTYIAIDFSKAEEDEFETRGWQLFPLYGFGGDTSAFEYSLYTYASTKIKMIELECYEYGFIRGAYINAITQAMVLKLKCGGGDIHWMYIDGIPPTEAIVYDENPVERFSDYQFNAGL